MSHNNSRRKFIQQASLAAVASTFIAAIPSQLKAAVKENENKLIVRTIYYWMKNPDKPEDKQKLIDGLKELCTIKHIKQSYIGVPETFKAEVVEKSFALSLVTVFDSKEDIEKYHKDPIHEKFVKECKPLWDKKVGYDSICV